jgi:hypothetical protein
MQNERLDLNILYYMIIRVDFNDKRGRGVAREYEYDARPSYDENVTNTHTHTYAHRGVHRAKHLCRCLQRQSTRTNKLGKRLRWSRGCVLAFSAQVRGFKPGRSRRIFQREKILSTTSFGGEVKPSVPCRRFAACKRSLK